MRYQPVETLRLQEYLSHIRFTMEVALALGRRRREEQGAWLATTDLPKSPGHVFYRKLNQLLAEADFDSFVEAS